MAKTLARIGPDLDALKAWAGVPDEAPLSPTVLKYTLMRAAKASRRPPIVWGIPTRGTISSRWLQGFYMQYRHPDDAVWCVEGTLVDANRNKLIEVFLQSEYDWMLQWDDDVVFTESASDVIARMIRTGQEHGARVIAGMYVQKREPFYPHIYRDVTDGVDGRPNYVAESHRVLLDNDLNDTQKMWRLAEIGRESQRRVYVPITDFVPNSVVNVDAVGGGCVLIHRSILEDMAEQLKPGWVPGRKTAEGNDEDPPPFFTFRYGFGEDMSFCYHVRHLLNEPIVVDTSVKLTHLTWDGLTFDHYVAHQLAVPETEHTQAAIDGVKERMAQRANGSAQPDVLAEFYQMGIEDWMKFANLDDAGVEWYLRDASDRVAETWTERDPKTREQVDAFYATVNYIPDLLLWNNTPQFAGRIRTPLSYNKRKVADFGAGIGTLAMLYARQGCEVYHVDVMGYTRDFAAFRYEKRALDITVFGDLAPLAGKDLDLISAIDTLEHIHPDAIEETAQQMAAALRPGGRVYHNSSFVPVGTHSETHPMHYATLQDWERAFVAAGLTRFDMTTWIK